MSSLWAWVKQRGLLLTGAVLGGMVGGPVGVVVGAGLGYGADVVRKPKSPALPPAKASDISNDPIVKAAQALGKQVQRPTGLGPTDNTGVK